MKNVRTWISRVSAIALVAVSVSASADINAPDFLVHKANVNLKTSQQSLDGIETETIKTKNVINYLMRRYADLDGKNQKHENLGLVTGCDTFGLDTEAVALAVYDSKEKRIKPLSDVIVFDIAEGNVEYDNKGELKKSNIIAFLEGILDILEVDIGDFDPIDEDIEFMSLTADVKYGKIGNKVVKDGLSTWNKDEICARNFKTKALTGAGSELGLEFFLRDRIVMSGKINAGSAQFGFNDPNFIPLASMHINKINDVDDFFDPFNPLGGEPGFKEGFFPATIGYTITVQNTGRVNLTGVRVEDVGIGEVVCGDDLDGGFVDFPGVLAVGEDVVCVGDKLITEEDYLDNICDIEDIDDPIGPGAQVNVAGANSIESNAVLTSNTVLFRCIDPNAEVAALSIIKTPDVDFDGGLLDTIDYEILVTNIGDEILTDVIVLDLHNGSADVECATNTLNPDDFVICTTNLLLTPEIHEDSCILGGIVRNVAIVTAKDPGGADIGPFAAEANVELDDCVSIGLPPNLNPF